MAGPGHPVAVVATHLAQPRLEYPAHHHGRELVVELLLDVFPGPQAILGAADALWLGTGRRPVGRAFYRY